MKFKLTPFARAAFIRAIKTMAQTAVSLLGVGALMSDIDWVRVLSASALSGIMYASRIMAGWAPYGSDLALYCVASTVIGGTSMAGGSGGVHKTVVGLLLMAIMFNAMTMLGVEGSMQKFIRGIVLITVIVLDAFANQRQKR